MPHDGNSKCESPQKTLRNIKPPVASYWSQVTSRKSPVGCRGLASQRCKWVFLGSKDSPETQDPLTRAWPAGQVQTASPEVPTHTDVEGHVTRKQGSLSATKQYKRHSTTVQCYPSRAKQDVQRHARVLCCTVLEALTIAQHSYNGTLYKGARSKHCPDPHGCTSKEKPHDCTSVTTVL